ITKAAKLAIQARLPLLARPPPMPTRFDSAMPTLKKRVGNFLAKCSVRVELCTSPSTTTRSGSFSPSCARARPQASRVDLPISRGDAVAVVMCRISSQAHGRLAMGPGFLSSNHLKSLGRLVGRQWLAVVIRVGRKQGLDRPALDRAGDQDA